MDALELRNQLEASRRFELEIRGIRFKLKLPSELARRNAIQNNRDRHGRMMEAQATRAILDAAVIGWEGLKAKHIMPSSSKPEDEVKFSADALAMLLEDATEISDELIFGVMDRVLKRDAEREAAEKN